MPPAEDKPVDSAIDSPVGASRSGSVFSRPVLAFGVPLVMLAAVILGLRLQTPSPVQRIAADYRDFRSGELYLQMETRDPKLLADFFKHRGVTFQTRVLDLATLRYGLQGGRVYKVGPLPAVAVAYRGPAGAYLLHQMYPGKFDNLPGGAKLREHDGIPFQVYRRRGLTLVFWQERGLVSVLVSDGPPDALEQLAFASAKPVQPTGRPASDEPS